MKRMDFYLSEKQIKKLKDKSKFMDIKTSDLLRRIIDYYFEREGNENEKISNRGSTK